VLQKISGLFSVNKEKKEAAANATATKKKAGVVQSTIGKVSEMKKTHPIHITAFNGYERYSYLLASSEGAQDIFGYVDPNADVSSYDDDSGFDEDYDTARKGDGDFTTPVNSASGRNTLKAFSKSTERGGRGGLRRVVHELSASADAVVIKRESVKNGGYYYGSLEYALRMTDAVPILVVCDMTEKDVRKLLDEKLEQPKQFKYVYGEELNKMDKDKRAKYDAEAKVYADANQKYWAEKSHQDYWKPLISKMDQWKKDGEKVQVKFVTEANLQKGKDFLQQALAPSSASPSQSPIKASFNDMLVAA